MKILMPVIFRLVMRFIKLLPNPIAKCLYGLVCLDLYSSRKQGSGYHWKDYSDLCNYLVIGEYRYESKIIEKLKPAHKEL